MCSDVVAALRKAQPDSARILEYRQGNRPERVRETGAADAGAGGRIEARPVGLTFDLAGGVENPAVAEIDGLRPVRTDVHPGAKRSVRGAIRESFVRVRP